MEKHLAETGKVMHCQPGNDPIEPHVPIATGCASMCRITNPATVIQYCPTRADVRAVDSQDYESNLGSLLGAQTLRLGDITHARSAPISPGIA